MYLARIGALNGREGASRVKGVSVQQSGYVFMFSTSANSTTARTIERARGKTGGRLQFLMKRRHGRP